MFSAWVSFRRSGVRQHDVWVRWARAPEKRGSYVFLVLYVTRKALRTTILLKRIESRRLHVLAIAASAAEEAAASL